MVKLERFLNTKTFTKLGMSMAMSIGAFAGTVSDGPIQFVFTLGCSLPLFVLLGAAGYKIDVLLETYE